MCEYERGGVIKIQDLQKIFSGQSFSSKTRKPAIGKGGRERNCDVLINYLSHISPSLSDSIDLSPPYLQEGGLQWRKEKRKASMQQLCKSLTSLSLSASTLVLLLLDQQGCSVHGLQKFSRESRIASHCCEYSVPCNHISVLWIREQSVLHCSASRNSASR